MIKKLSDGTPECGLVRRQPSLYLLGECKAKRWILPRVKTCEYDETALGHDCHVPCTQSIGYYMYVLAAAVDLEPYGVTKSGLSQVDGRRLSV